MKKVKRPTRATKAKAVRRTSPVRGRSAQTVYETLKRDIVEMTALPGDPIDETSLSHRFRISRTPVREALVRLAAEGLVTTLPNRNTMVAAIDFASIPVYFDALTLMYRVTTRLAALHRSDKDLEEIRALQLAFTKSVAAADALAMIGINRDFHLRIAEAGGNVYFTQLFARLLDEGRRLLRIYYSTYDDHLPREYVVEHDAIIEAIVARDADRADTLATEHAMQVVRQIQNFLASGIGHAVELNGLAGGTTPATNSGGSRAPSSPRQNG
jgi:DNA-binding GntR family transcriptional regulator